MGSAELPVWLREVTVVLDLYLVLALPLDALCASLTCRLVMLGASALGLQARPHCCSAALLVWAGLWAPRPAPLAVGGSGASVLR